MAIYRSSDSLSRCDPNQYSTLYDVRKRPDIKHEPVAATRPIHKDTIEISRDKLKEEALNRLRHTSKYVLPQNNFMRIGKYLFLAVALPPYFMIYGLPKWILVEGMPAIFSMSLWMWKKIQHQTQKQIEAGNRKVIQMVQYVQKLVQVLMQPIIHLALQIRLNIRRFREFTVRAFRNRIARFKQSFHLPRAKLANGFKLLQKRLLEVREKWSKRAQKVNIRMQQGIQFIKEAPPAIVGWAQVQYQRVSQQALSMTVQWKNRFQTSQEFAQRATDWVGKLFKNGSESFKRQFDPLIHFYQEEWLPVWRKVRENCKQKWLSTRHFFERNHQRAFAFLQVQQEKLKRVTTERVLNYLLAHPWMGKLPGHIQEWLKKCLAHPIVQSICTVGVKLYTVSVNAVLEAAKLGLKLSAQGSSAMIKCCNLVRSTLKMAAKYAADVIKVMRRAFRKGLLYTFFYFLLFLTMALILFIWGIRLLGDYTSSFIAKLSLRKRVIKLKG